MSYDTSIKISKAARERLVLLAAQRGTTMRELVERMTMETPTREELAARAEEASRYLRERMGITVTEEALTASARLREAIAERSAA
jgi:hypothetical protein